MLAAFSRADSQCT